MFFKLHQVLCLIQYLLGLKHSTLYEKCDLIIMSLKIKLKMLLKKKEKCLSEYVQISIRGLSKQGLTPSLPMRSGPSARGRSAGLVPQLPAEQLSTSPPGKRSDNGDPRTSRGAHMQTLGSRTASAGRAVWAVTRTAAGVSTGCATGTVCGRPLSACSRPAGTRRDQPWRSTEPLQELVTEVGLVAQKSGITQPNRLHSSYWEPLETAAHPMKVQLQQQTTFLRECLLQTASLQPPVRSNH